MPDFPKLAFSPIASFNSTFGTASANFALEATGTREYRYPGNRSVRVANLNSTQDYHMKFGDSTVAVSTSTGMLLLGGTTETFSLLKPSDTHVAFVSSTDTLARVNVTIGQGF